MTTQILIGDCREVLKTLPENSVQCVVTSPPYYGLRSYGMGIENGEIGLEQTPHEYVENLVAVFREVRRVLRGDGTVWLNIGDSYNSGASGSLEGSTITGGQNNQSVSNRNGRKLDKSLKPKDLIGIPWRVAFALQADGWFLRQDLIWNKPNPMPESVTDRCTKSHEYVFLLSKSARYFYDAEGVKENASDNTHATGRNGYKGGLNNGAINNGDRNDKGRTCGSSEESGTRNRRSVWTIATTPYSGSHFATMPPKLAETCILAGTSEAGCCSQCGTAWVRVVENPKPPEIERSKDAKRIGMIGRNDNERRMGAQLQKFYNENPNHTIGFRPACTCNAPSIPCTVLDPFGGSGTTGEVAQRLGRDAILIELNPDYLHLADRRTAQGGLMLGAEAVA